jgi:hypothetical protein
VSTLRDSSSSSPHLKMGWQESGDWDIEATSFYLEQRRVLSERLLSIGRIRKALVFTPLSSPAPKEDSARLSLYAPSGPGLSEIALVVESEKRSEEVSQSGKLPGRFDDTAGACLEH